MIPKNSNIAVLIIFILSLFISFSKLNADVMNPKTLIYNKSVMENSYGEGFRYVRILKDYKWWIYVYDGAELVDVYPE